MSGLALCLLQAAPARAGDSLLNPAPIQSPEIKVTVGQATLFLVRVPAGWFTMGTNAPEHTPFVFMVKSRPVHKVTLTHNFWMGKCSVTQGQWQAVMGNNPSFFKKVGPDAPVETVSWEEAQKFLARLNDLQAALTFRLPTEAEWEYACRAGTLGDLYAPLNDIAWYEGSWTTHPVGQKLPNRFGLYDMIGNVAQWCQDWFGPYSAEPATDPQGPAQGTFRVVRGGGWNNTEYFMRSASRWPISPDRRVTNLGFRVVAVPRNP